MKFTLKDYQRDAVDQALQNLERGRTVYHRDGKASSFSLTATTGAGKTVMAAAAIEALFYGSDEFAFDPDPGAVVIWFSDDPNLNDQTRMRLMEASEKFSSSNLRMVQPPFAVPRLEPGKVYFLNTQRLAKTSLLTRGHVEDPHAGPSLFPSGAPDLQGWTIWETIANTINDDDLTLYLVLDEAHRGFDEQPPAEKPTLVRRLVNGHAGYPPVPIVWGISATIDRFQNAMKAADANQNRRALERVLVDPGRVQESGLIKDTLLLDIPNEAGNFDSVLVRRGARKLRESTERWSTYGDEQGVTVQPLLVLQTPNTPDRDQIGAALNAIVDEYPTIRGDAVRHVFGEHAVQRFGSWDVEWIEPQRVEESTHVRILIAKDAISTGWDCPRAEVMVSFRPAQEQTHITQLLGRFVRSPLARRIPGDERLNAVDCILPFFDRTTAGNVVKYLTGQIEEMPGTGPKPKLDPRELHPNPSIPEAVWDLWDALPTETLPQRGARPVKRLVALAQALSADGIRPDALKAVEREVHRRLEAYALVHADELEGAVEEAWTVQIQEISGKVGRKGVSYQDVAERADDRAISSEFEKAKQAFGADIARSYANHLAGDDDPDADDDGLRDAYVKAAALATIPQVREKIDADAGEIAEKWFAEHRHAIAGLRDLRRQEYEDIRAMTTEPQLGTLSRPRVRIEDFVTVDDNGQIGVAPLAKLHLMTDQNGDFPLGALNDWERDVVQAEIDRHGGRGWYRNPPRASVDSVTVAYRDQFGNWRSMHPDFVFFQDVDGTVRASIVDPHGHHLPDAAIKLRALATFAEKHGNRFHRIEAVTELSGSMVVLDLQRHHVRHAILHSNESAVALYGSDLAAPYGAGP